VAQNTKAVNWVPEAYEEATMEREVCDDVSIVEWPEGPMVVTLVARPCGPMVVRR
jgi:hypothetical protein